MDSVESKPVLMRAALMRRGKTVVWGGGGGADPALNATRVLVRWEGGVKGPRGHATASGLSPGWTLGTEGFINLKKNFVQHQINLS